MKPYKKLQRDFIVIWYLPLNLQGTLKKNIVLA